MLADNLFHPYHVIPASEFIAALMKCSDFCISEMRMEIRAVCCQVFIILIRIADAGIQIQNTHFFKRLFHRLVEHPPHDVQYTAISFEYETPALDEWKARMARTMSRYPYLVIEQDGVIRGYILLSPCRLPLICILFPVLLFDCN